MRFVRRIALASAVATACVAATVPVLHTGPAGAQENAEWSMGGHDIGNSRSNPSESILNTSTARNLALKWTVTTAGDVSATPAVVDGAAYFPDWGGTFWKVDADTGQVIWSRQVADYVNRAGAVSRSSPAVAGNTVYIGIHDGAELLAIDTATGNLRWSTVIDTHPNAVLTQSPAVHNGVVYQGVSSDEFLNALDPEYACCTFRGSLVAVDAASGAVRWKSYTLPDQGSGADVFSGGSVWGGMPSIDPQSNTVFVGTGQNYSVPQSVHDCQDSGGTPAECLPDWNAKDSIVAMDLTTGAIKWATGPSRFDAWNLGCLPGFPPNNCPNPGPDHDTSDGTHLYSIPGPGGQQRTAVGAGQKSGEFWMLDAVTGAIIWSASVGPGSLTGGIEFGTATDGQRIYFAENNGDGAQHQLPSGQTITSASFGALDVATGRILWQVAEPNGGRSTAAVSTAGGVAYFGGLNGYMYALDAATGELLWEYQGEASSAAGPAIVDGTVFWGNGYQRMGTTGDTFYAFSAPGSSPTNSPTASPTASPTGSPTSSPTTSPTSGPAGACTATYQVVNQWSGGFQGEVTVRAGTAAINGWTVRWTFPSGQTLSQVWNASATSDGANVTVSNASYNGTLASNATTSFGFLGAWNGSNTAPASLACTSP
jgi:polyvinyl alcohol dehydrogenase (cytochrome)